MCGSKSFLPENDQFKLHYEVTKIRLNTANMTFNIIHVMN